MGSEEVLQKYKDLRDIIAILGMDELSQEDSSQVARARKTIKCADEVLQEIEAAIDAGRAKEIKIDEVIEKVAREDPPCLEPTLY
ncbi:hypothetical protein DLD99_12745 [Pseudomonas kribbensis]|uniref:ATP synthase A/B type C-terminal domain-containing protein n=1 Tax=Pseudomonas kribbensis TaxID=1628086 RepID=A0A345RPU0_9PSED|nr:hypothetical protein DLD99_12745 [Pseudomonas kribbensis]